MSDKLAFEEVEHTADQALRIYGSNLKELMINAAHGLNSILVAEYTPDPAQQKKSVKLDAFDIESLLVEWLSELAYWAETEMLIFHEFDIESVSPTHLRSTIYGSPATHFEKHIKAVTYHNLKVAKTAQGLVATVVFDV
jgi:SHS2 domain-containing protein